MAHTNNPKEYNDTKYTIKIYKPKHRILQPNTSWKFLWEKVTENKKKVFKDSIYNPTWH